MIVAPRRRAATALDRNARDDTVVHACAPWGPPLVHRYYVPSHHADEAFRRAIRLGVVPHHWRFGPMPPIGGLDDRTVTGVIGYVRWLQRQRGIV